MKKKFIAKLYPNTLSEITLETIILELFNIENFIISDGFTVDYLDTFYKNFNFATIINIVDFINMLRFDPHIHYNNTEQLIKNSFSSIPIVLKESLREEFLKNWKSPNIKNYHSFIQTCVTNYYTSHFFNNKLELLMFDTWRNIDVYEFKKQLSMCSYEDFYEELRRIEFDCIELLL